MKKENISKSSQGFTLLELLVVVVIIGLLAAIALPQYQLAVDKAEFAKYQSMVSSLRDAYDEYVMLHGQGTKNFEDLSFSIPDSFTVVANFFTTNCISNDNMWCCMSDYKYVDSSNSWSAKIYCGKKDADFSIIYYQNLYNTQGEKMDRRGLCIAKQNNTRANRLCDSIGIDKKILANGIATPEGLTYGYFTYTIK